MTAQKLSKYKWENRVLIIAANSISNPQLENQLKELQKSIKGLHDRKLITYTITPNQYAVGIGNFPIKNWNNNSELYNKIHFKNTSFEVILIGLDGGEKLRQTDVLVTDKLFTITDGMPMRRSEVIKNKQ